MLKAKAKKRKKMEVKMNSSVMKRYFVRNREKLFLYSFKSMPVQLP